MLWLRKLPKPVFYRYYGELGSPKGWGAKTLPPPPRDIYGD